MKKVNTILKALIFIMINVVIIFNVLVFLSVSAVSDEVRARLFYNEQEKSIDVAFIGPSTVRADIIPTKIYEKTGITSYCYTINNMPIELYQSVVQEFERTQKPQLYVIDINSLTYNDVSKVSAATKTFLNGIKDKKVRDKYIEQLIPKKEQINYKLKLYQNHSNWKNIAELIKFQNVNIKEEKSILKGFATFTNHSNTIDMNKVIDVRDYNKTKKPIKSKEEVFGKLLDYISENNLNVLFIKTPRYVDEDTLSETEVLNYFEPKINQKGYEFINFDKIISSLGLGKESFSDKYHCNNTGAIKFTETLTEFMIQNYNIIPSHDNNVIEDWGKSVKDINKLLKKMKEANEKGKKIFIDDNYLIKHKKLLLKD